MKQRSGLVPKYSCIRSSGLASKYLPDFKCRLTAPPPVVLSKCSKGVGAALFSRLDGPVGNPPNLSSPLVGA